jgi:HD-GYP domain-containing protein (c-di-GMP phosphodiesterase class II)
VILKVVLNSKNDQFSFDLKLDLVKNFGCEVLWASNLEELLTFANTHSDIVLFVHNEIANSTLKYEEINKFFINNSLTIPIAVITNNIYASYPNILKTDEKFKKENLNILSPFFVDNKTLNQKESNIQYIPIKIENFLHMQLSHIGCDVYIRLNKKGVDHYVKRLHSNEYFSKEELEKYVNSGLKEFYVTANEHTKFIETLSIELTKSLMSSKKSELDRFNLHSCAYETAILKIKSSEVDLLAMTLVEEAIKSIFNTIEKDDSNEFKNFFEEFNSLNHSYSFCHFYFICLLAKKISTYMDWNSDQSRFTFIYLAFFHDISLTNLELAKTHNTLQDLSASDLEIYLQHANQSALIVEQFKKAPIGISQIVREHHGSKDGLSIESEPSYAISHMAMMFIVLEDYTKSLLELVPRTPENSKKILEIMKVTYMHNNYKTTLEVLTKVAIQSKYFV